MITLVLPCLLCLVMIAWLLSDLLFVFVIGVGNSVVLICYIVYFVLLLIRCWLVIGDYLLFLLIVHVTWLMILVVCVKA